MFENNNKGLISRLSMKIVRNNRSRNIFILSAIILTAALFTSLFTIGITLVNAMEAETMRMVGTTAHGGVGTMTEEEYNRIKTHSDIKEFGNRVVVGSAENEALSKRANTQIQYEDENYARWGFHEPAEGKAPEKLYEALMDSKTLELLGITYKPGAVVPIQFSILGRQYLVDFVLSGYFEHDEGASYDVGVILVSQAFIDKYVSVVNVKERRKVISPCAGSYDISINLNNSRNIENKIEKIIADSLSESDWSFHAKVNWAYTSTSFSNMDPTTLIIVLGCLFLILTSGYLIIYNIFRISIVGDIRFYGLLKTIGMTPSQLKSLIRKQVWILSALGIPPGLLCGYLLGNILLPFIVAELNIGTVTVSLHPLIFIFSSVFTIVTLKISAARPEKIASSVSPMESLRFNEVSVTMKKSRKIGKNSICRMAWYNIFRFKGKTVSVIASLSLSVIVLLIISTLVGGFDQEKYVSALSPTHFSVGGNDFFRLNFGDILEIEPLDPVVDALNRNFELIEGEYIYHSDSEVILSEYFSEKLDKWLKVGIESHEVYAEMILNVESYIKNRYLPAQIYGIHDLAYSSLDLPDDKTFLNQWKTGDYVITSGFLYKTGDRITISSEKGDREYTVLSVSEKYIKPAIGVGYSYAYAEMIYMPASAYIELYEDIPYKYIFNSENADMKEINEFLVRYTSITDETLNFTSRLRFIEEFRDFSRMFLLIGGILSSILGLIGLLNLTNSIFTGIISRRREFAGLQSIGMTSDQLIGMLIVESLYYALLSIAVISIAGIPFVRLAVATLGRDMWYFSYHFPAGIFFSVILVLLAFSAFIPCIVYRNSDKLSIVQRLRMTEN